MRFVGRPVGQIRNQNEDKDLLTEPGIPLKEVRQALKEGGYFEK